MTPTPATGEPTSSGSTASSQPAGVDPSGGSGDAPAAAGPSRLCRCGCGVDLDAMNARLEALLVEQMPKPAHLRPVDATLDRIDTRLGRGLLRVAVRLSERRSR